MDASCSLAFECSNMKLFSSTLTLLTLIFVSFLQVGYDLKEEIERKFDKWQEPPPVKQVKPLPAPLDGQRKKRGGRRYALSMDSNIWRCLMFRLFDFYVTFHFKLV